MLNGSIALVMNPKYQVFFLGGAVFIITDSANLHKFWFCFEDYVRKIKPTSSIFQVVLFNLLITNF